MCVCMCCVCVQCVLSAHTPQIPPPLTPQITRSSGVGSVAVWGMLRAFAIGQLAVELLGKLKDRVETWGLDSIRRYYE